MTLFSKTNQLNPFFEDIMYLDFDYMNDSRDFSLNNQRFAKLPELIKQTKRDNHFRWTFIVDPVIEGFKDPAINPPFNDGYEKDVYIKWDKSVPKNQRYNPSSEPLDKDVFYGKLWPSAPVAFPDFFKNRTHEWWQKWILYFYNDLNIKFDALWIVSQFYISYDFSYLTFELGHE